MPKLDEYRRKRDFGVTPEPSGEAAETHAGLRYVIQKHAASHLHWDFRIELDGVMLSWAVPKGPSLDPADKRLAMHVEDHPVEYGSFEGVIPKGEYGGGTVMLWDRGVWEPDHGDPRAHLAEGHLKFYLFGERLKGRWMLVRTKGYGGKSQRDSWLLFKERDDEVREHAHFDAIAEWTTSVATGRTMEEIAADTEAVWRSSASVEQNVAGSSGIHFPPPTAEQHLDPAKQLGAKAGPMPRSIDVQLATLVDEVPQGERWLHEIKFDGYRIVAFLDRGKVRLISRNGKEWTERFPDVVAAVAALPARQAILDGEVVVLRPDGTTDFQALQNFARRHGPAELHYMLFDLLYLDGVDLRGVALEDRKRLLRPLVPQHSDRLRYTDHIEGRGDSFYSSACDHSLEGIVSKRVDAPYRSGRARDWLKTKCLLQQEFVVVGYTDPGGSRHHFGALVLAVHENGELRYSGRVGSGFSDASLREIAARLKPLERDTPPVTDPPAGPLARGVHWVEPELVAQVSFAEWTEVHQLRHPSFLGLREDKSAAEVTAEKPAAPPPVAEDATPGASDPARAATGAARPGTSARAAATAADTIAGVKLTHPDRVLWPDVPFTKLELVRYYEAVAEHMLPHVVHRPLSLVRCPGGYTGECFYQKHVENFPSAVGTVAIFEPENDKQAPYACVTGLAGVVGLAQMGVLEIHPWGARADDPEKPDRLIFDLDPDPALPWETVAGTAQLLRSELSRLDLLSWVKTTGGKGLHVVVPVRRTISWDDARLMSKAFVDRIVAIEPRLFTSNMSKANRDGRIFIDYLRNARGSTAVAPYSTRARPSVPVSVPLTWDELAATKERPIFSAVDVPKRLAEQREDPWAEIGKVRQSITAKVRKSLGMAS